MICIILISWSYKLFFSKKLELFALNLLLLPFTVLLLSLFFEILDLSVASGFVAEEILLFFYKTDILLNTYYFYLFISINIILFLFLFYFTMGLKRYEWNEIFKFIWKAITLASITIRNLYKLAFSKNQPTQSFSSTDNTGRSLEPKIDFETLRNQPVNSYSNTKKNETLVDQQDEIIFESNQYRAPDINILSKPNLSNANQTDQSELQINAEKLKSVLTDFKIEGEIIKVSPGPIVTMYELQPAPGIKASKIISLSDDIARNMSAMSARVAIIPGKNVIGIEIPNKIINSVFLSELFKNEEFVNNENNLILALGKDISGNAMFANLENMPHLLIAGTTGSGKSVGINVMITSILFKHSPEDCKFILIDPKMLELSVYEGVPHLITPVVTDPKKAIVALKWVVREMETRYKKMSLLGVRNIENYNQRILRHLRSQEKIVRSIPAGINPETGQPETKNRNRK